MGRGGVVAPREAAVCGKGGSPIGAGGVGILGGGGLNGFGTASCGARGIGEGTAAAPLLARGSNCGPETTGNCGSGMAGPV